MWSVERADRGIRPTRISVKMTSRYPRTMTKRLVDIDDELLAQAREVLGTATMKDTVNRSLREVVNAELRRDHVRRLTTMEGLDLDDPEVMAGAWRS